ncbi:MAG: thioredoxin domain-containing protein, partial [Thermoanaerobaculia bacterium]
MAESPESSNRLARESSPYLRLHAGNPVDWYPWGGEALERARREDKPIFLSIGYSTCYWCHVMERESFSDPAIAAEMNRAFVNIKVDREERPDLDEIYMVATQVLSGQGGWPNSLFLTPKLEPFFAGTYFPPEDRHGRPGFPNVLRSMAHAWRERRADVEEQAGELAGAIRHHLDEIEPGRGELPGAELALRALEGLRRRFDATWGGFGEAPKFPTPSNLWLLAELAPSRADAAMMLGATLEGMARGGIFDQLAGGFHRYATDREWRVPHFEKMLYDNGLLLEAFAGEHARTGSGEARRVALETAAFLARELTSPEGAFWSAIDAETDGREGAYYVWSRAELEAVLGEEDAAFLAPILGFSGEPFFEGDRYVLHLPRPLDVAARERHTGVEELAAEV